MVPSGAAPHCFSTHHRSSERPPETGAAAPAALFSAAELCQAVRDLRRVTDDDRRVQLIVQIVSRHGLGYPEVVAAATVAIEQARISAYAKREALAALNPAPPIVLPVPLPPQPQPVTLHTVEADPELTRLAIGLGEAAAYRLWLISRALDVGGVGQVSKAALEAALPDFGVTHTRRYLNRLIRRGNGIFWAVSADSTLLHLRSYEKVALRLTEQALREQPALVATNAPGQKFKTCPIAGSIADFEGLGLAAWVDSRRDQGMTNIAIATLGSLFGRSANTIRDWLVRAKIIRQYNYSQYAGSNEALIPQHATLYVTKDGSYKVSWQVSSSYHPPKTKERQHRYTPRHVYHVCQRLIEDVSSSRPAGDCGTALEPQRGEEGGGVNRTGRLFFESSKGSYEARKRAGRHVQWHQDVGVAHHVLLGFKRRPYPQPGGGPRRSHDIGVYECLDPAGQGITGLHERSYKGAYQPRHRQQLAGYRDYLKG